MAGKTRINIEYDKVYQSNFCGPFKIIEDLGRDDHSRLYVKIKFLNTGTESVVRYDIAMAGKVNDIRNGINFNQPYESYYYGPFIVTDIIGRNDASDKIVKIKFLNTGYETDANFDQVLTGKVIDKTVKYEDRKFVSIDSPVHDKYIDQILRQRWHAMMRRCYNQNNDSYINYGKEGIRVCNLWQTIDGYLSTITSVQFYEKFYLQPDRYALDKDFKQLNIPKNQRIYSPETCIFLNYVDNDNLAIKEKHKPGEYYGIRKNDSGNYTVTFSINGKKHCFGTYTNLVAAINEYHYYYFLFVQFELVPLLNDGVPFMPHLEAQKYLIT